LSNDGGLSNNGTRLTHLEELALAWLVAAPPDDGPHPLQPSVLVEVDAMAGRLSSEAVFAEAVATCADAGSGIHFDLDQNELDVFTFDGAFGPRQQFRWRAVGRGGRWAGRGRPGEAMHFGLDRVGSASYTSVQSFASVGQVAGSSCRTGARPP